MRADLPPLHVVTDDATVARDDFLRLAREIVGEGGSEVALHLRAPAAAGLGVYRLADALRAITHDAGALLIVNDRLDVALAVDTDGVQLGTRGLLAADARALMRDRLIGVSAHGHEEAQPEADFLLVGNVYATASHPGRVGIGTAGLVGYRSPVIAIGGVTPERVAEVRAAGVHGIAAIRGIWDAPSPARAVRSYLREWRG